MDDAGKDGALAVAGRQGDDGEEVEGLVPVSPGVDHHPAGACGCQDGEAEQRGEIGGGLGGSRLGADVVAQPVRKGPDGKLWELGLTEGGGRLGPGRWWGRLGLS